MMYLVDFIKFIFEILCEIGDFIVDITKALFDIFESLWTMIQAFPAWLSVPFGILLVIAVLFRVSQFIPTIGGAST